MARRRRGIQSKVRLRPLTRSEQRILREKLRDLKLPARLHRRYQIVAAAHEGATGPVRAQRFGWYVTTAYHWVARFNTSGFAAFERPSNPRGRIPIVTAEQLRELMDVALSSPRERGLPFSVWSVPKLAAYCRAHDLIPPFCDEWVRRLLRGAGMRAQRIRTWTTSRDPAVARKREPAAGSTPGVRRARRRSASTNGGPWNSSPSAGPPGPPEAGRGACGPPTADSKASGTSAVSTTCTATASAGCSGGASTFPMSSRHSAACGAVTRGGG